MIPNSAFITIGESSKTMEKVEQGLVPGAEYAVLRRGHFGRVLTMTDRGLDLGSLVAGARFALSAYRETWDAENVFLGEEFPGIQYLAIQAALRRKKRIVMLIHNVSSLKRRIPLGTLGLGQLAEHLLCLSAQSRRDLVARYGVAPSRITVVGSRVNTDYFAPDPAVRVLPQVCSAGVVNRDYGTLIEAVRPLGVRTKIAADTAWRFSAKPILPEHVPPFVEMRSWETYPNLRALYAQSAVIVVPLLRPHILSGITVALEGMAMGKPVILTYSPYVEDFLTDGETGYFVQSGDAEGLRVRIQHLLDYPEEAERVGARARQWVLERFTVDRYVQKILGVWG